MALSSERSKAGELECLNKKTTNRIVPLAVGKLKFELRTSEVFMKNLLILTLLIVAFSINEPAQSLTKVLSNMQSETSEKVKQMLRQTDSERNSAPKPPTKNFAVFKPSPSENLKNIADEMGKTADEKAMFLQLFTEVKKNFEAQAAAKKNNVAAAMTFLMATAVMVYHESPEPTDTATEKLFDGLNSMFDEMPEMASASHKDKQFLYDLYISYGGLILASYQEAVGTKNKETIDAIRVLAGSTLLDVFKINPNTIYFEGDSLRMKSESGSNETRQTPTAQPTSQSHTFAKRTTNFDDGWVSTPTEDYVSVQRNGTEVRLFYDDSALKSTIPNTVYDADFYWDKYVMPNFNIGNPERVSSGGALLIYTKQMDGVDRQTGKRVFVTLWYVGGINPGWMILITPNRAEYQRQFPNEDSLFAMRYYNKFAVTTQDVIGNWTGGSGNFVEYANIYTGNYAGMSALNIAHRFVFRSNGTYQQNYDSADTVNGSTRFANLEYKGKFTVVNDWEVTATNHYNGTTARFDSQIKAVKGGYLLVLRDMRNDVTYKMFKKP